MRDTFIGIPGRWIMVRDDDGHDYIIPQEDEDEFREWAESFGAGLYNDCSRYRGKDFGDYRTGCAPSCFVFVGTVEKAP